MRRNQTNLILSGVKYVRELPLRNAQSCQLCQIIRQIYQMHHFWFNVELKRAYHWLVEGQAAMTGVTY